MSRQASPIKCTGGSDRDFASRIPKSKQSYRIASSQHDTERRQTCLRTKNTRKKGFRALLTNLKNTKHAAHKLDAVLEDVVLLLTLLGSQ